MEENSKKSLPELEYENLVLSGKGFAALVYGGVFIALEQENILPNIKKIIGSSAGSLAAFGPAFGYTADEMRKILLETDFKKFFPNSTFTSLYNLFWHGGVSNGGAILQWIQERITAKKDKNGAPFSPDITFKQLHELKPDSLPDLYITGTDVSDKKKAKLVIYSWQHTPNMKVKEAIRKSTTLPVAFQPFDHTIDGGYTDNLPTRVFDNDPSGLYKHNKKTLAFYLHDGKASISSPRSKALGFLDIIKFSPLSPFSNDQLREAIKEQYELGPENIGRTIKISTHGKGATDVDIPLEVRGEMMKSAYNSTMYSLYYKKGAGHKMDIAPGSFSIPTPSRQIPDIILKRRPLLKEVQNNSTWQRLQNVMEWISDAKPEYSPKQPRKSFLESISPFRESDFDLNHFQL